MARGSSIPSSTSFPSLLPAIGVAIPIVILGVALLSVLFAAAETFGLSAEQTSTLMVTSYGVSGALSLVMSIVYRQPLFLIWSSTGLIFMASLAETYTYAEMLGATFVAGAVVLILGLLGLSSRLARLIPASVVLGVMAGLVMPYVVRIFNDLGASPSVVGPIIAAFVLGRRLLPRIPPILPALVAGFVAAGVTGDLHRLASDWTLPTMQATSPAFTWTAIMTMTPVLVVLIAPVANLSAVVMLRNERYDPPARVIDITSGACTMISALFAPVPVNMGHFVTPLTAGPHAGEHHRRYWSVLAVSGTLFVLTLTANVAVGIPAAVPVVLLFGVAGLALVSVLSYALTEVTKGPLKLGPLFAFVIASSTLSLGGFGAAFWALVIGIAVTLLLEQRELRALRTAV